MIYLGSINDNNRYLTKILLITSKKAITRNWCKAEPPTIEQWKDIIRGVYHGENDLPTSDLEEMYVWINGINGWSMTVNNAHTPTEHINHGSM